jgi:aminopeptidase YwaD
MNLPERISEHIHYLSAVLGPRPSGSVNNQAAEAYLRKQFSIWNYCVETQPFACQDWFCKAAELEQEGQNLPVLANPYTPACDVTADLALAATLAELETVDLEGKIALLYGDLSRQPLACKGWFLKEERDVRIIELLEQKRPAAVLMAQATPGSINRLIEDWEFLIPSATLPHTSARQLISHPGSPVSLHLDTTQKPVYHIFFGRLARAPEVIIPKHRFGGAPHAVIHPPDLDLQVHRWVVPPG